MIKLVAIAVILSVISAAFYGTYKTGYDKASAEAEVERLSFVEQAAIAGAKQRRQFRQKELAWLNQEKEVITQIEIQEKEIIRYVEVAGNTECLDVSGVQLFNQISAAGMSNTADLP